MASSIRAKRLIARRWNGRRRAARAPAALPGSSCRTSPAGSQSQCRKTADHEHASASTHRLAAAAPSLCSQLRAAEVFGGIDRGRSLAYLEMQLGSIDIAGLAGASDNLPALDRI